MFIIFFFFFLKTPSLPPRVAEDAGFARIRASVPYSERAGITARLPDCSTDEGILMHKCPVRISLKCTNSILELVFLKRLSE